LFLLPGVRQRIEALSHCHRRHGVQVGDEVSGEIDAQLHGARQV
jgi:hypothetical protein